MTRIGSVPAEVRCYGLRRVNPFLGVVAVVQTAAARALSVDGVNWSLQVLAHPPRGLWAAGDDAPEQRYFRFGGWSPGEGMTRVPLTPILDVGRMISAVRELVAAIEENLSALPFPLAPELELWLLDQEGQPLALLATCVDETALEEIGQPDWIAGGRGERPFVSSALTALGIAERDARGSAQHAEFLERRVYRAAGPRPRARWFRREPGAGRRVGVDASGGQSDGPLPAAVFPRLHLRAEWPGEQGEGVPTNALVADYLGWLSPYLLTLPYLPDDLRARLEREARRHALAVDLVWRLYPKVLDPALVRRSRVEAKLRRSNA